MKTKIMIQLFQLTIGTIGLILLTLADWKIAVGVFLVMWSDNIVKHGKPTKG